MQGIGTGSVDLSRITTFLFDLDGVMWRGETAIEGAAQAVNELRETGRRCLFCTNNSSKTAAHYVQKLKGIGVEVAEEDILTSSWVTAHYLSGHFTGPFLAYVIGEEGIHVALQKIGARIVPDSDLDEEQHVDCVVVGMDRQFNYEKLKQAQRLILAGALFIATNRDGSYPVEGGLLPGSGSIVAAVEAATGMPPVTVGKPRPVMIELARQKLNANLGEMAMVGDRLDTDIVCARRAGITAICVTTGVTSLEKAQRARGELRPHYVFDNLTTLCQSALEQSPTIITPLQQAAAETPSTPESDTSASSESTEASTETPSTESTFTLPPEVSDAVPEEKPNTEAESTTEDTAWTEDIDKLFDESQDEDETIENAADSNNTIDLDTALSVSEPETAELPASQKPQAQDDSDSDTIDLDTALSVSEPETAELPASQKPQAKDDSDSGTIDLDTALSEAKDDTSAQQPQSKEKKQPEKESSDAFDWKLD